MRIAIVSNTDISVFSDYFSEESDKIILQTNKLHNYAPAVDTLILSFLKSGCFVRVFTLAKSNFIIKTPKIEIFGIEFYNKYPVKFLWGDFINSKNIAKQLQCNLNDIDILHAQWTYYYAYACKDFVDELPVFCSVRDWTPIIWSMESLKNKLTWTFRLIMNELVLRNKKMIFIANSDYTAQLLKRKLKIDVPVIHNSIKDEFLNHNDNLNSNTNNILCISSSNDKRKNIECLLYAFRKTLLKYPDIKLNLIGSPFVENQNKIIKWKKKGLLRNVNLLGSIPHNNLISYYNDSFLFITPSLEETFGNTVLEAMARKIPVIAGDKSGALPYVLDNGRAGFLCDVKSSISIAKTIESVIENRVDANARAEYAYIRVYSEFNQNVAVQKHLDIYLNHIQRGIKNEI